jgi:hypothetical protein
MAGLDAAAAALPAAVQVEAFGGMRHNEVRD